MKLPAFVFKFQSKLIKYSFLKYLFPSKERRTLDAQIAFRLHRRFRNLIFASGDKGPLQFRTSICQFRDVLASSTYWIGNCMRRIEKRNRNDRKKSFTWVEMALWGDLTIKYIHPFCYFCDLSPLPFFHFQNQNWKPEKFQWYLDISPWKPSTFALFKT